jgi:hypothetical protein
MRFTFGRLQKRNTGMALGGRTRQSVFRVYVLSRIAMNDAASWTSFVKVSAKVEKRMLVLLRYTDGRKKDDNRAFLALAFDYPICP